MISILQPIFYSFYHPCAIHWLLLSWYCLLLLDLMLNAHANSNITCTQTMCTIKSVPATGPWDTIGGTLFSFLSLFFLFVTAITLTSRRLFVEELVLTGCLDSKINVSIRASRYKYANQIQFEDVPIELECGYLWNCTVDLSYLKQCKGYDIFFAVDTAFF